MLKEVTGTESFDSRVDKMKEVLGDCSAKKEQMDKILDSIRARLEQLGQEIEEYREVQQVERHKKALELALFSRKMAANQAEIDSIRQDKGKLLDERQLLVA